jgi:AmiR/NasT family two-component response regulator
MRILIADDHGIVRSGLRKLIESEDGLEVVAEAADGIEARDLALRELPDLAILDVKMPVMDGIEAARVLTEERRCAVVLLTAFSQRELIEQARDAGVMAYVVKPFQRSDLVPAIEIALGRFKEVSALVGKAADLEERLEIRKLVDRAKGRLIDEHHLSEEDAFGFLQKTAMNERRTIKDVCNDVVAGTLAP